MTVKRTNGGKSHAELTQRLERLLVETAAGATPEQDSEIDSIYRSLTGFKQGCPPCMAGRRLLLQGLKEIRSGNSAEGLSKVRGSMRSVSVKWGHILSSLRS